MPRGGTGPTRSGLSGDGCSPLPGCRRAAAVDLGTVFNDGGEDNRHKSDDVVSVGSGFWGW